LALTVTAFFVVDCGREIWS